MDQLEFSKELDLLHKYKFANCNKGSIVVFGFRLLLRDCWWALKVKHNDESSPEFLCNSYLGSTKVIEQVVKIISMVADRLPLPVETVYGFSVKGQKAKTS